MNGPKLALCLLLKNKMIGFMFFFSTQTICNVVAALVTMEKCTYLLKGTEIYLCAIYIFLEIIIVSSLPL